MDLPSRWYGRPAGVYVFSPYFKHYQSSCVMVEWDYDENHEDLWEVSYIGPAQPDDLVYNGLILQLSVPPEYVTLVTGNN